MRFSGKFTDSALPIAVGCSTRYIADAEVHRHTTGPDAINPIFDNNQSGIPNWLPESRLKAMHNDVNILVPICIEVLDPPKGAQKISAVHVPNGSNTLCGEGRRAHQARQSRHEIRK